MKQLNLKSLAAALIVMAAPLAHADTYPPNVTGSWSIVGNLSSGTLNISSQATTTGKCPAIAGTVFGHALQGFYCPGSGRIHFVRKLPSGVTIQAYTGQVSDTGPVLRMGGAFSSVDTFYGGNLGEYNFSAQK